MAAESPSARSWLLLRDLAKLGPRRSGTEGGAQALAWLDQTLGQEGLAVRREAFLAPSRTLYWGPVVSALPLVVLAVAQLRFPHLIGALAPFLMWLLLVPLVGELLALPINLDLILPRRITYNLDAPVTGEGEGEIVLVAHHDTQWSSWLFHPRLGLRLRWYFLLAYLGLFGVPVLSSVVAFNPRPLPMALLTACTVLLAAISASLAVAALTGQDVVGANDNGSGVACAIALAGRARAAVESGEWPRDGARLRLLLTGGEEVGARGMLHWLKSQRPEPASVVFVNLDNVAGGGLRYLRSEGMALPLRYSPALIRLAERLAEESPADLSVGRTLLLPTDMMWTSAQGYAAITFIGQGPDGTIPNYHWPTDTAENISPPHLGEVEDTLFRYLAALWREAAASKENASA